MSGFAFHPEAFADLEEIREYIARDSLDAADTVMREIFSCISGLVQSPHRGHLRPDLTSWPLRFVKVYDYLIAYAPDESPLWVIAVIHGRRNPRLIGSLLRHRG